jgi:methylated-DNA-[protein]-cysteine S-methyltransferase
VLVSKFEFRISNFGFRISNFDSGIATELASSFRILRESGMTTPANFQFTHPRGTIYGWFSQTGLRWLELPHAENGALRRSVLHSAANDARVWELNAALERYFAGLHEDFASVPLGLNGATAFQHDVWLAARDTPWGVTQTYGDLARRLGKNPGAARAVGTALGANPLAIVIPCHRFLGKDGALHGYAAGLEWKRELLRIEGALLH